MPVTIHSILQNAQRHWPRRPFVYTRVKNRFVGATFGRLARDVQALAAALQSEGLGGKNILLLGQNSYRWMVADLAISGYVGVCVAANPAWPVATLQKAVEDTHPACILYGPECAPLVKGLRLARGVKTVGLGRGVGGLLAKGRTVNGGSAAPLAPQLNRDALCKIFFSSGTTGGPKPVMLCQRNLFAGLASLSRRVPLLQTDRCYLLLPLYHTYGGIYNFLYMLHAGARLYLAGAGVQNMVEEMQMVRPTIFCGVPKIYVGLYAAAAQAGQPQQALAALFGGQARALFCGGSPSGKEVRNFYHAAGLPLLDAYALTETASSLAIEYPHNANSSAVGTVFEDMQVRIAGCGKTGEVRVKGDGVFLGYYGNTAATKAAFDEAGFFKTGDVGYLDAQNRLYITGRLNRIFNTAAGNQVDPAEVEKHFAAHTGALAARVYCEEGEVALALHTKLPPAEVEKLVQDVNQKLPRTARIKRVRAMQKEELPGWKG